MLYLYSIGIHSFSPFLLLAVAAAKLTPKNGSFPGFFIFRREGCFRGKFFALGFLRFLVVFRFFVLAKKRFFVLVFWVYWPGADNGPFDGALAAY